MQGWLATIGYSQPVWGRRNKGPLLVAAGVASAYFVHKALASDHAWSLFDRLAVGYSIFCTAAVAFVLFGWFRRVSWSKGLLGALFVSAGVLLMSADRHRSDLWKIARKDGYPLYEFNSSRLTNQHVHKTMPAAEFSYNKKQSFGLVEFDTTVRDPTVRYSVVTIDDETVHSFAVKRSQLSYKSE